MANTTKVSVILCFLLLLITAACVGSLSVKEFDATTCGVVPIEECKKLQEKRTSDEELRV